MFDQFYKALDEYKKIAHPDIKCGSPYALVPEQASIEVKLHWPRDEWPNSRCAGVYAIFSADETLLYVGKSGLIGRRLYDHFREDANGACISPPLYRWSKSPIYVITVAAPADKKFVASCLEEYLIEQLQPCDNTRGIK
jgi:hypothetical protein